ncbi:uncharacterized protein J4E79_007517 [Alternaria viburni]|uniref:uncharacterized protein n=1 Tax=Alternaria viburni TaxID=566460 RepID=UPI0020C514CC|nr:uncharacterized protein J4E79_007517 [Alternaria viburni]KAI4657443.1 hypothetical protein J4E79_007517 [Alternaria viburni]
MASSGERLRDWSFEGSYTNQDDLWSAHYLFPKIGKEASEEFVQFFRDRGITTPTLDDGVEQYLKLQTTLWKKPSRVAKPGHQSLRFMSAAQTYRWSYDQVLAEHAELVIQLLEGRGSGTRYQTMCDVVFILDDKSKKPCGNPSCPTTERKFTGQVQSSLVVTLEPLLDWGTVEPASDITVAAGRIFPFRRSGPRMKDPLWTQVVRKLVPQQLPTYCLGCIGELVDRHAEVRLVGRPKYVCYNRSPNIMTTLSHEHGNMMEISTDFVQQAPAGQPQGARHLHSLIRPIRRPTSKEDLYDLREGDDLEDDQSVGGLAYSTTGSLYLDGVTDETPHTQPIDFTSYHSLGIFSTPKDREASWTSAYNALFVGDKRSAGEPLSPQCSPRSFTTPLDSTSLNRVYSPLPSLGFSYNTPPPTPVNPKKRISKTRIYVHRDPESVQHEDYEKLGSKSLLPGSIPDFGSGSRRFGRDIDTNAVRGFFTDHRVRRENMAGAKGTDIRNFFTVINPEGPSTPQRAVKTKNVDGDDTDLSDVPSDISEQEYDPDGPGGEYTPAKNKGKASSNKKTPSPPSKPAGKKHSPKAPMYRKRDPAADYTAPFGVTKEAFETHLQHLPAKTDLICSCRKPARTNEVQITQCMNKDCRVRWYHKECLDRIGKLKARHGTYFCEQCQNEKYYADLSQANGWTTKKLVQNEIGMPFTGQEVAGTFGNTGDFQAAENPYGFGMSASSPLSPSAEPFVPNSAAALSRLAVGSEPSLGLATSRPYFVNEAYTRGQEHARNADEDYEHARLYGCYPERCDEDGNDGDDEDSYGEDEDEEMDQTS